MSLPSNETISYAERIEQLSALVESLTEQLAASEQHNRRLSDIIEEQAEDLIPFDGSFHRPSAVTSVGYHPTSGQMLINGTEMMRQGAIPANQWELMTSVVRRINGLNAEKRAKAREK